MSTLIGIVGSSPSAFNILPRRSPNLKRTTLATAVTQFNRTLQGNCLCLWGQAVGPVHLLPLQRQDLGPTAVLGFVLARERVPNQNSLPQNRGPPQLVVFLSGFPLTITNKCVPLKKQNRGPLQKRDTHGSLQRNSEDSHRAGNAAEGRSRCSDASASEGGTPRESRGPGKWDRPMWHLRLHLFL